jgi:nucleoside-diphosphate-sugar epimerase
LKVELVASTQHQRAKRMSIKRILITGSNSYVGTNVEKWLMREPEKFYVETISVRGEAWKSFDFSKFDVVFHVAGIAHVKESKNIKDLYYKVNTDLAYEVAKYSKNGGVKQFIYMSSMSVFGRYNESLVDINNPIPNTSYGNSKFKAELLLASLNSSNFDLTIIRAPVIFGNKSPGNFSKFLLFSKFSPFFFNFLNRFNFIYIDNLSEFIKILIIRKLRGIFHPRNTETMNFLQLYLLIRTLIGKKSFIIKSTFLKIIFSNLTGLKKHFNDLPIEIKDELIEVNQYNIFNNYFSILNSIKHHE